MSIKIINVPHPDVSGGGKPIVRHDLTTGPRNLLRAVTLLDEARTNAKKWYGNVGCGHTWMEIDGQRISDDNLHLDPMALFDQTPTAAAKKLIADVRSGAYARLREVAARWVEESIAAIKMEA